MEEALRAYLAADAPLTALVDDEIQWGRRNGVPAVTLHLITAPPSRALKGPSGLVIALVQADCRALTFLSAKAIGEAVAAALPPIGLTFEGVKFLNCAVLDTERTTEGEGQNTLFRTRHDLRVSYHLA